MTVRLFVAAIIMFGIYFGAESLKGHGMPSELAHLAVKLDTMPRALGSWRGTDEPLDPQVFRAIGAESAINRAYRDEHVVVNLHIAAFTDLFMQDGLQILHSPEVCYPGNGYVIANAETIDFTADDKPAHAARFLTLDHDGMRVYCLYWYQVGTATFWERDGQRRVVQSFRGRATWPPMIKVMLQTAADSPEEAQGRLKNLASLIYPWTREYH
jgi:EpsI family protein